MECPITAVFPTRKRIDAALRTLRVISECDPKPAEIIVHVDGANDKVVNAIKESFPQVRILSSSALIGPGGARNRLVEAATHELVANFDDDSFPAQPDYFACVLEVAAKFPDAAVISASSWEKDWRRSEFQSIAAPSGCGCIFRKSWFAKTAGFVPLPIAYNMEEVDIGLQLHALGGIIVHDPNLRVIHDHPLVKTITAESNCAVLANTALLPFLRYPWWLWPVGFWQVSHRIFSLTKLGWTAGLFDGVRMIPDHFIKHHSYRKIMPGCAVLSWLLLRRRPKILTLQNALP